jgi:hypothetical protein
MVSGALKPMIQKITRKREWNRALKIPSSGLLQRNASWMMKLRLKIPTQMKSKNPKPNGFSGGGSPTFIRD